MIRLEHIHKRFGDVVALEDVTLNVASAQIHGLLGENGAGKTTLMRVLFGLIRPDRGQIYIDDQPVTLRRPEDARSRGVAMVHQHFALVDRLTVADNVLLGDKTMPVWTPRRRRIELVRQAAARVGIDVDAGATVGSLSVGQRQRVELLRALHKPARLLILDEPTAVLAPAEVDSLLQWLRGLRARGTSVIFITHKLREIMDVCDVVTVLRHGRNGLTREVAGTSTSALAAEMIGATPDSTAMETTEPRTTTGTPSAATVPAILKLENVSTRHRQQSSQLDGVNLELQPGRVVGVVGVEGNGQSALVAALLGSDAIASGRRWLTSPFLRIAHLPDDRQREGLVLGLSVAENAILRAAGRPVFSRHGWLRWRAVRAHARRLMSDYRIRAASEDAPAAALSGGNQQKLIVARELAEPVDLVIAVNPTRGLDIAATELVRGRILAAARGGAAVVWIASDLDEVLAVADRLMVLFRGRLMPAERRGREFDGAEIGRLMAGTAGSVTPPPSGGAAPAPGTAA